MPNDAARGGICLECEAYRAGPGCPDHPKISLADPAREAVVDVLSALDDERRARRMRIGAATGTGLALLAASGLGLVLAHLVKSAQETAFALIMGLLFVVVGARLGSVWALSTFKPRFGHWTGADRQRLKGVKLLKAHGRLRRQRKRALFD